MPNTSKRKPKTSKSISVAVATTLLVGNLMGYQIATSRHATQAAYISEHAVIQVRFSPGGRCTAFVAEAIAKAKGTILVQAYSFTSVPIADALIAAHQRGVDVKILVDRSQRKGKYTQVPRIAQAGISVSIDKVPGIAHNKVMIIDDEYVLTGSFNWTQAAETRNAENLLFINDTKINDIYKAQWRKRAAKAQSYDAAT